jgi:hypothetical protein
MFSRLSARHDYLAGFRQQTAHRGFCQTRSFRIPPGSESLPNSFWRTHGEPLCFCAPGIPARTGVENRRLLPVAPTHRDTSGASHLEHQPADTETDDHRHTGFCSAEADCFSFPIQRLPRSRTRHRLGQPPETSTILSSQGFARFELFSGAERVIGRLSEMHLVLKRTRNRFSLSGDISASSNRQPGRQFRAEGQVSYLM